MQATPNTANGAEWQSLSHAGRSAVLLSANLSADPRAVENIVSLLAKKGWEELPPAVQRCVSGFRQAGDGAD